MSIKTLQIAIANARAKYQEVADTVSQREARELTDEVKRLQQVLSDAICHGADPCPDCGGPPIGMVQPCTNGEEFEVGCPRCGYFIHDDGSPRDHGARGGLLPKHTVEAWNAGPDFWKRPSKSKDTPKWRATLNPRPKKETD